MEAQAKNEMLFYQDMNVTVTQSRYITNSRTYVMSNISSVHVFEIVKNRTLPIIMAFLGIMMLGSNNLKEIGAVIALIGIVCLLIIKNDFAVRISTNSGEANSIVSRDKIYIEKIVNALNEAIVHRG